jgi:hypothetical protein
MSLDLNLSDFALPEEGVFEVKNAAGELSGWRWRMAGPGHPAAIAADKRQTKRFLDRSAEQDWQRANGRKVELEKETPEEFTERTIDQMVARVLGWNEGMTLGGNPFPCTPENARQVLSDPAMGIYGQLSDFLRNEQSFTKRSAKA